MQTLPNTRQQLLSVFDSLSPNDQQLVLTFAQKLAHESDGSEGVESEGIPVDEFIQFFREHPVTAEEAENMRRIMDEIGS